MNVTIRPTDMPLDAEDLARIQNEYDPEPLSPDYLIDKAAKLPPSWTVMRGTATVADEVVGFYHWRRMETMKPGVLLATVAVAEAWRGKGVGSQILEAAESHARREGSFTPHAMVREDVAGATEFFGKRGYKTAFTLGESVGDLERWQAKPGDLPQGYQLLTWADTGDTPAERRKLYELMVLCDQDEPGTQVLGLMDYVAFERDVFEEGCWRPDWIWILAHGDEWVAVHTVARFTTEEADAHKANVSYTGTAPGHRGKGLATWLKANGLTQLKSSGVQTVLTHNDTTNQPMLRVNDKMGVFTTRPGWAFMAKPL